MNLSFQPQFKNRILGGTKIHTIRADKTDRWKVGNTIHFCTGLRTKEYNCFKMGVCASVQKIEIVYKIVYEASTPFVSRVYVKIDQKLIFERRFYKVGGFKEVGRQQMEKLAVKDGFKTISDFFKWFDSDFEGKLIHWTEFKY